MHKLPVNLTTTILLIFLFSSCKHLCDCEDDGSEPCAFSYEKVAYVPNGLPGDQLVSPVFADQPPGGAFSAEPAGLSIDPETGVIDVNASEYGKEYTVKFRIDDSEVICVTQIFIDEPAADDCELDYGVRVAIPGEVELLEPKLVNGEAPNGTFTAIPPGLDINPKSGVISVNTSDAGTEYRIMYTSHDKKSMCETSLLVSGIDYLDTIIDLGDDIEDETISPIWNADPEADAPEGQYDVDGRASAQGLAISSETGSIDVLQTLKQVDQLRRENNPDQNPEEPLIDDGEVLKFTFLYIVGSSSQDATIAATQEIVIYWFEDEISDEIVRLIEEKSLYPQNGREMSPPPLIAVRGSYL